MDMYVRSICYAYACFFLPFYTSCLFFNTNKLTHTPAQNIDTCSVSSSGGNSTEETEKTTTKTMEKYKRSLFVICLCARNFYESNNNSRVKAAAAKYLHEKNGFVLWCERDLIQK